MTDQATLPAEPGPGDPLCLGVRHGTTQVIWMNDPKRRNPLSLEIRSVLIAEMTAAMEDPDVRAIVLVGAGGCFCAGGDIAGMKDMKPGASRARLQDIHRLVKLMHYGPKPVIAAVEGWAVGGGLSLAAACDVIVASREARFALSFAKIGLMPDLGALQALPARIGLGRTKLLAYTARTIDAETAAAWGVADELCAPGEALAAALKMADEAGRLAPLAVTATKQTLARLPQGMDELLSGEADTQALLFCTDDFREGAAAFLEKRAAAFKGV